MPMSAAESETVNATRRIHASPERVFEAWVDANLLKRWLAPEAAADPRLGGQFRLAVSKGEETHVVTGEYRAFVPGRQLVMTWVYEGPMAPEGKMEALLTVGFSQEGEDTEVSLRHEHLSNPTYRDAIRQGAWTKALDGLEAVLAVSSNP